MTIKWNRKLTWVNEDLNLEFFICCLRELFGNYWDIYSYFLGKKDRWNFTKEYTRIPLMTSFVNSLYVDKFVHIHWPGATTNCLQYHFNVSPCSCILSILYTNGKYALFFISVVLVFIKQFFGQKWSSVEILTNVMYFRCPALMSKFNKPSQSDFYCLIEFSSIYTCQFPLKFVT